MKKIIFEFTIISFVICVLFIYNVEIKHNLVIVLNSFIKNILPSLFSIIFISSYIKYNILSTENNKYVRFISLLFSYAPSNSIIAKNKSELLYSTIINPLFSYSILKNIISIKYSLIIIFINMFINYLLLFKSLNTKPINVTEDKKTVISIIKETTLNVINICGVLIFFNILISILSIFISKYFLFFFEITNGYIILKNIANKSIRLILITFLNSFGGLSIFFQIKSINNDAIYKLIINKIIISILITIITYVVIMVL